MTCECSKKGEESEPMEQQKQQLMQYSRNTNNKLRDISTMVIENSIESRSYISAAQLRLNQLSVHSVFVDHFFGCASYVSVSAVVDILEPTVCPGFEV